MHKGNQLKNQPPRILGGVKAKLAKEALAQIEWRRNHYPISPVISMTLGLQLSQLSQLTLLTHYYS